MKIAFLVEPEFFNRHVGVRNYFLSLLMLLKKENDVEIVSFYRNSIGDIKWYKVFFSERDYIRDNGNTSTVTITGNPEDIVSLYHSKMSKFNQHENRDLFYQHIGGDLSIEEYSAIFITNPWLVDFSHKLIYGKMYGIVYDTVPNNYILNNINKPYEFAYLHKRGFEYFNAHCDHIFCISEVAKASLINFFKFDPQKVSALPPLIPNAYFNYDCEYVTPSQKNVALAGPLDLRKGLREIPAILNSLSDQLDNVLIYGDVRCAHDDFVWFFNSLRVKNVIWQPKATATNVQQLFENSRFLLFPSHEEGLGLPIIEAQLAGCPVVIRDKAPMNHLALDGHLIYGGNADEDFISSLALRLKDNKFNRRKLSRKAQRLFSPQKVHAEMLKINSTF